MPRICFVIMPFSHTASGTEEEWTELFESVLRPAIEGSGLDYECRRSVATRGNIVGAILRDLNDAYVVVADLTDRNANVFYELGVRHALTNRTILLAQRREDIPFDLTAYANHVYEWRTVEGRAALGERLKGLLADVDINPNRPDNPVSDFLRLTATPATQEQPTVKPEEVAIVQPLVGPGAEGLDAAALAKRLYAKNAPVNPVLRETRRELRLQVEPLMDRLNQQPAPSQVPNDQIYDLCIKYVVQFEPFLAKVESYVLSSVEEHWTSGSQVALKVAGDLMSMSAKIRSGRSIKPIQGTPALLGWRLLLISAAKALKEEDFQSLGILLSDPIEVEDSNARFTHASLRERRTMAWPDAFLGRADVAAKYLRDVWERNPYLHAFFDDAADFYMHLEQVLMLLTLSGEVDGGYPIYPAYKLLPDSHRAASALVGRLSASEPFQLGIASALHETSATFSERWPKRAEVANEARLGSGYFPHDGVGFPLDLRRRP